MHMKAWAPQKRGFTIVELLIVIVVIGILASITIVAYNGIQQRARDTQRKSDLASIAKVLQLGTVSTNDYIGAGSGCGHMGMGNGFVSHEYAGYKSIATCLTESGTVAHKFLDPSETTWCSSAGICRAYMKYTCPAGTYLYASLESEPAGMDGPTNGTCDETWDTYYGMNYVIKVD